MAFVYFGGKKILANITFWFDLQPADRDYSVKHVSVTDLDRSKQKKITCRSIKNRQFERENLKDLLS